MDIEQILTQILIAFFTVIFFVFACRVKSNIEKRYRKGTENLQHSKEKIKEISFKQTILCKKVLCESTNRHHRSIIAASLKQTLDEEMEKLEHIKDSIKLVQQMPDLKPSFQQFNRDFFPDFGGVSAFNLGSKEANGDTSEKCLVRGKDSRLQTKLCNAWRAQSRRFLNNDNGKVKNESKNNWNDSKYRHIINQFSQPTDRQIQALTNFTVNNVSIINYRDNHLVRIKETLDEIMEMEPSKNVNESMKTLPDFNSDNFETMQDITHTFSLNDLFSSKEKGLSDGYTKQINLYDYPHTFNNRTENNNGDVKNEGNLLTTLDKNHNKVNQLQVGTGISCRQIRHDPKNGRNRAFQFDFVYCRGKEHGVKIMIELKNNKSVISYDAMEECLKIVNLKMFQVSPKKNRNNINTVVRYVFKISLKINKRKVVLKCVISCFEKGKQDYKQLGYRAKQQLQNNTNCCKVQSKHRSFNRKPHKKRHSLYTNTSLISTEEIKSKHNDNTYHSVPKAEGDISLTASDHKREGSILHDPREHIPNIEHLDRNVERAVLKMCMQLPNKCRTDYSDLSYTDVPQLMRRQTPENEMLSTLEEELTTGSDLSYADVPQLMGRQTPENEMMSTLEEELTTGSEESFEKVEAKVCPFVNCKKESYQRSTEQRLGDKFGRNELVKPLPLFCDESTPYGDNSKIQSEILTTLNLKASQILGKINSIRLKETNRPRSNISETPTSLNCVFELRSYDETMFMQDIFMNRFFDDILNNEDSTIVQNIFQNQQPPSMNDASSTSINNKDQNEESQIIEYTEPLHGLDRTTFNKDVALGQNTATNSFFVKETVFMNPESDELYYNTQNSSSAVVILEGAVFSSSDNSATIIWEENESQADMSDDELSKTSGST